MQAQKLSSECNVADPGEQPSSPPSGESGPFELDWRAAEFTAGTAGAEAVRAAEFTANTAGAGAIRAAEFTADTAGAAINMLEIKAARDGRARHRRIREEATGVAIRPHEQHVLDAEAASPREAAWEAAWESASPRQAEE